MTFKTTRFYVRKVSTKVVEGIRRVTYFQMGDVAYFGHYKHSEHLLLVTFYNGLQMVIEHPEQDFLICYEKSRISNLAGLN